MCTFYNIFLFMSVNIKLFLFGIQFYLPITTDTHYPIISFIKPSLPYSDWYKCSNILQLSLCYRTMFLVFSSLLISLAYRKEALIYTYYLSYIYSHSISMVLCTHWSQKKYFIWMNEWCQEGQLYELTIKYIGYFYVYYKMLWNTNNVPI